MDGILIEATDFYTRIPRRGAETGGILLGQRDQDGIVIQDFLPVPSEHRFGRLYRLSDLDRSHLQQALDAIARKPGGMEAVGLYRSHAREEQDPIDEDAQCLADHLADDPRVLLLVRPSVTHPTFASFYFLSDGRLQQPLAPVEFPFRKLPEAGPVMAAEAAAVATAPVAAPRPVKLHLVPPPPAPPPPPVEVRPVAEMQERAEQAAPKPAATVLPLPAPSLLAPVDSSPASRKFIWVAVASLLGAAVIAGDSNLRPAVTVDAGTAAPPPSVAAPEIAPPITATEAPIPVPPAAPAPPLPVETRDRQEPQQPIEVRTFLDRWADAVRQGRIDQAAGFYAPAERELARSNIAATLGTAERMDVFRLSGIAVDYPAPGEAVAHVRQHWQSGEGEKSAGEQSVSFTLRALGGRWQIVSEQVDKVHWIQKVR